MCAFVDSVFGDATGIIRVLFGYHASLPIKHTLPFKCESFQEIFESLPLGGDWSRLFDLWWFGFSCLRTSHRIVAPHRNRCRELYRVRDWLHKDEIRQAKPVEPNRSVAFVSKASRDSEHLLGRL
jgi:hypothetical protein